MHNQKDSKQNFVSERNRWVTGDWQQIKSISTSGRYPNTNNRPGCMSFTIQLYLCQCKGFKQREKTIWSIDNFSILQTRKLPQLGKKKKKKERTKNQLELFSISWQDLKLKLPSIIFQLQPIATLNILPSMPLLSLRTIALWVRSLP